MKSRKISAFLASIPKSNMFTATHPFSMHFRDLKVNSPPLKAIFSLKRAFSLTKSQGSGIEFEKMSKDYHPMLESSLAKVEASLTDFLGPPKKSSSSASPYEGKKLSKDILLLLYQKQRLLSLESLESLYFQTLLQRRTYLNSLERDFEIYRELILQETKHRGQIQFETLQSILKEYGIKLERFTLDDQIAESSKEYKEQKLFLLNSHKLLFRTLKGERIDFKLETFEEAIKYFKSKQLVSDYGLDRHVPRMGMREREALGEDIGEDRFRLYAVEIEKARAYVHRETDRQILERFVKARANILINAG